MVTHMENPARLVPQTLDLVDLERWDRPAVLVGLVAAHTWEPCTWAQIGRHELRQLGRSAAGVKWDLEVLDALAGPERRVLRKLRVPGHPSLFRVRHPVEWRQVPWIGRRRDAMAMLRAIGEPVAVDWWTVFAGQRPRRQPVTPPPERAKPQSSHAQTTGHQSTGTGHQSTEHAPEQGIRCPQPATNPREVQPPVHASKDVLTYVLPSEATDARTDVEQHPISPEAAALVAAVSKTIGAPIFGAPRQRIAALAGSPDALDAAGRLTGVRSPTLAAELLEDWLTAAGDTAAHGGSSAAERARRAEGLRRYIAVLEDQAPDDPRLEQLRAELAGLQDQDTPPG